MTGLQIFVANGSSVGGILNGAWVEIGWQLQLI